MKPRVILSQSFIKAMDEEAGRCPARAKACYLDGYKSKPSAAMTAGNHFETVAFGQVDSGEKIYMDRLKSGAKSTDQIRIEHNAWMLLNKWVKEYQMDLHQMRPHITVGLGERYVFRARMDAYSSMLDLTIWPELMPRVIVDFKLSAGLHSTYGDFSWGAPELMDHTQAYAYTWAYMQLHGEKVPFYYFVISSKAKNEHKRILKEVNPMHLREFKESLRRTIAAIDDYDTRGMWPRVPGEMNCRGCPLKDSCDKYRLGRNTYVVS